MLGKEGRTHSLSFLSLQLPSAHKASDSWEDYVDAPGLNVLRESKAGTGVPTNLK